MTGMRHDDLDTRVAIARRSMEEMAREVAVPPWREPRRRLPAVAAAAVLVLAALVAGVVVIVDGGNGDPLDLATGDERYYEPGETLGLPLLRAVRGDDIPAPGAGDVVVYGDDPELRGRGLIISTQQVELLLDLQPSDGRERVDVAGAQGLLAEEPDRDVITISWQSQDDVLINVLAVGFGRAEAVAAAEDVVVDADRTAMLQRPSAFGVAEVVRGPMTEILPSAAGGAPARDGHMLRYASPDGAGPQLSVTASSGDHRMVDAIRLAYPGAQDTMVGDAAAVAGPIRGAGDEIFGWVLAWQSSDGSVFHVIGTDLTREEVQRVAESVRPIGSDRFAELAASDDFEPDEELPGLEADEVVVARGELSDGSAWRLHARDPDAGGAITVAFTWVHDRSSTSSEIGASSKAVPSLLVTRSTNVEPEHVYGFVSSEVETLTWQSADGGGSVVLVDVGDRRGRYFVTPLAPDTGPIALIARDANGGLVEQAELAPEGTLELGVVTATTTPGIQTGSESPAVE